ncbi:preprotein translocase subunit Sss1 [Friedmanniella endophytica]|uniref:Preprotein translocase subunit Sss1 n=1 Tax=Microlunatus kandeliicorticis TaxID=1759536 RepID=A0A7W3P7S0_9ACTN|nr:preprotein translocase subunit Sss1 [Microlunatus kandeliicorticis]
MTSALVLTVVLIAGVGVLGLGCLGLLVRLLRRS